MTNKYLELLNLNGLNLGDEGMGQLAKAFCQCLEDRANGQPTVQAVAERDDQKMLPKYRSRKYKFSEHEAPP